LTLFSLKDCSIFFSLSLASDKDGAAYATEAKVKNKTNKQPP
jgi:hypothetical protein